MDYDTDLDRFLTNQTATRLFSEAGDLHVPVATRLSRRHAQGRVLDLGGGNGLLARHLQRLNIPTVVLDQAEYISAAPRPAVRADALHLPFREQSFTAVAALWMLYHLTDPISCLRGVERILRPEGEFVACAPSRYNDPECKTVLPGWGTPSTFDAEDAVDLVSRVFEVEEADYWDAPLVNLPDVTAVATFLRGRGLTTEESEREARGLSTPMTVTKRGVLIWARRR